MSSSLASKPGRSSTYGRGDLVQALVGHADDLHELDRGMRGDVRLDLDLGDVLAADLHHLLQPAEELHAPVGVERAAVARVQPAVGVEGLARSSPGRAW